MIYSSIERLNVVIRFLTIFFTGFILSASAFSQKVTSILTREIIVTRKDSVVRANILVNNTEIKINEELTYYWYFDDNINSNKGGYTGDLLHGPFTVLDMNSKLITKGIFLNGLKHGVWKYWYPNGNLKTTVCWEKGIKNGELRYFNKNGELIKLENYRNNLLNGEVLLYKSGEVSERILFRNGKEKQIKEPEKKGEMEKNKKPDKPFKPEIIEKKDQPDKKPFFSKQKKESKENDQ